MRRFRKNPCGTKRKNPSYNFVIPTWAITVIAYGDTSGITDKEERQLNKFLRSLPNGGSGSWTWGNVNSFTSYNDVDNLGGEVQNGTFTTFPKRRKRNPDGLYKVVKIGRKSRRRQVLEVNLTLSEARRVVARYPNSSRSMVVFYKQKGRSKRTVFSNR